MAILVEPATPPAPVTVARRETQGVHDVYFVFKSDRATPTESLMALARDVNFFVRYGGAMPTQSLMTLSTITWLNK